MQLKRSDLNKLYMWENPVTVALLLSWSWDHSYMQLAEVQMYPGYIIAGG